MSATAPRLRRRVAARVEGTVQGVGFRPHVYRLARELGLSGYVRNDERGVALEVEGEAAAVNSFLARLASEAPPLARVERVLTDERELAGKEGFSIVESERAGEPRAPVTPDTATCDDCLAELFDPGDRRHRYPFVNCTNCGPRFTIVRGVPYDRPLTTMAGFEMCDRCRAEYEDPLDRRFHAQPNACPVCGPSAWVADASAAVVSRDLTAAADALRGGAILAIKGLGGFHLSCVASSEDAVAQLRARKHREDKPFALMAPDVEAARSLVDLDDAAEVLLVSRERPIVLAPRRLDAPVAAEVAPGLPELGVMLPYSPLHHLLLADTGESLVMTSGNVSDEPIAFTDEDALQRLAGIAELFLLHDRPIETRTDDSVVRPATVLRRSRGYVPAPIELPVPAKRHVLACGAELKNTFTLAKGKSAWVSHHIGDLENYETLRSFRDGIAHFQRLFAVEPEVVAHDLHPDYLSTKYALERDGVELVGVQHHHAHLAACLAEHGVTDRAVGAIFDGTGYGTDGTVWGGEILVGDLGRFERAGHLFPVRMPGGAAAVREPWRMACAWLAEATGEGEPELPPILAGMVEPESWCIVARMAEAGVSAPMTSSMGRLFDAVAALCGLRTHVNYEGQAAIGLEAVAATRAGESSAYPMPGLDARETIRAIDADVRAGVPIGVIAARFHNGVAAATASACESAARSHGLDSVVLSGGVFQNRLLLERISALLADAGLRVLVPERLPANDGGISYGQTAVAVGRSAEPGRVTG